tara:strand:- start:10 stop:429 length:420 start_codon:yes stop_codon:yes gene_type:complete
MQEIIVFERAKFWYEDGILFCKLFNKDINHNLSEKSAQNYINAMSKLCQGRMSPFVIDVREAKGTYTSEAAKLISNSAKLLKVRLAEAYVLNSMGSKLTVVSYKRIFNPNTDYDIFKSMKDAIAYCNSKKEEFLSTKIQ